MSGENAKMIFCVDYWDLSEPGGLVAETIATNPPAVGQVTLIHTKQNLIP
ncbi:MAG: hypothetical protein Q8K98_02365 [Bacteroidota bacterium]|nr:hypothetical protein [Bacteroidota bacterium]